MSKKTCSVCGIEKPLDDFQKRSATSEYRRSKCNPCRKRYERELRDKKPGKRVAYSRDYRAMHKDMSAKSSRAWREKNPEKRAAHIVVTTAIASGRLKRAQCMICGHKEAHGHHDNYDRPLDVVWLCRPHHSERHRSIGNISWN